MSILKHRFLFSLLLLFLAFFALFYDLSERIKLLIIIVTASACLVLLLVGRLRRSFWHCSACAAVILMVVLASVLPSFLYQRTDDRVQKRVGSQAFATVLIHEITYEKEGFYFANGTLRALSGQKENVRVKLSLTGASLEAGDVVAGTAEICAMDPEDEMDAYSLTQGYRYTLKFSHAKTIGKENTFVVLSVKMRTFLCNTIEKYTDDDAEKLLCAMLLGEKDGLSSVFEKDMQRLGLSHMLALSGMHFSILLLGIERLCSFFSMDKRLRYLLLFLLTLLYVFAIGAPPSALRAGIMMLCLVACFFFGKEYDALTSLAFSVALICTIQPFAIHNVSLLLSAFATFGILLVLGDDYGERENVRPRQFGRRILSHLLRSVKFTLAASFATLPFIALRFGTFPLLLVLTNLLFAPLMQVLLYAALLVLFFGFVTPIAQAASFLSESIIRLAAFFADIPHIEISIRHPILLTILLGSTLLFAVLYVFPPRREKKARFSLIILTATCLAVSLFGIGKWLAANDTLSVHYHTTENGAGDLFLLSENGYTAVIDSSRGTAKDITLLFSLMEKEYLVEIDAFIATGYRTSYFSSLKEALENRTIHELFLPIPETEEEEEILLSLLTTGEKSGTDVFLYEKGKALSIGSATFCLHGSSPLGSSKEISYFTLHYGKNRMAYLSAEVLSLQNWEELSATLKDYDALLFGAYGSDKRNGHLPNASAFSHASIFTPAKEHLPFEEYAGVVFKTKHTFSLSRAK